MKTLILSLLISMTTYAVQAQSIKVVPVTDKNIINLLSSINQQETFDGKNFYVKIFIRDNPPGSANIPEGHEISNSLLLVVGEYDLYFEGKLYNVGQFFMPVIRNKSEANGKINLIVEHGFAGGRKEAKITVELNKVIIQ